MAAASPANAARTETSIAPMTASAVVEWPVAPRAQHAPSASGPWTRKTSGSPTRRKGWEPAWPSSARQAFAATSGPIPAGSPIVMRMGEPARLSAGFDIGLAPQIAQIAPGEHRHLFFVKLLLDLIAGGNDNRRFYWHGLVAAHDQLHARRRREGFGGLAGRRFCDLGLHAGAEIGETHCSEILVHRGGHTAHNVVRVLTVPDVSTEGPSRLRGAFRQLLCWLGTDRQ